jgi:hypothetical protein
LALYFLPAIVGRKKRAAVAIFALNLLLGASGVFWIIALVWALTPDPQPVVIHNHASSQPVVTAQPIEPTVIPRIVPTVIHRIAPITASAAQQRKVWPAVVVSLIGWTVILAGGWYGRQQGWFDRLSGRNSPRPITASALVDATPTPQIAESPTRAPRVARPIAPLSTPSRLGQPTPAATFPTTAAEAGATVRPLPSPSTTPTPARQHAASKSPCLFGGKEIPCS